MLRTRELTTTRHRPQRNGLLSFRHDAPKERNSATVIVAALDVTTRQRGGWAQNAWLPDDRAVINDNNTVAVD